MVLAVSARSAYAMSIRDFHTRCAYALCIINKRLHQAGSAPGDFSLSIRLRFRFARRTRLG
jgi:hypothetical protein